jgi:AraC family transcriptional regulator
MDESIERAVGRVIVAMRENLSEQFTIDDMARTAMFSKFHFSRLFQRATGVSPGRFLSAVRFQQAKELLVSTSLTVTDVSHRVGYTSVGTFSSRFRRSVGVSPTTYRQLGGFVPAEPDEPRESSDEARGTIVRGQTETDLPDQLGLIFVGLFADPVPQSQPVRFTVLHQPGQYVLEDVPQGSWYLLAHSVAAGLEDAVRGPIAADEDAVGGPLAADQALRVGFHGPIKIQPDTTVVSTDIQLQPLPDPVPPMLNALLQVRSVALGVAAA